MSVGKMVCINMDEIVIRLQKLLISRSPFPMVNTLLGIGSRRHLSESG